MAELWRQRLLMSEWAHVLLPSNLVVTRLTSNPVDDRIGTHMVTKSYDLTDAVTYHIGTFPHLPSTTRSCLEPLEEAAASLRGMIPRCRAW